MCRTSSHPWNAAKPLRLPAAVVAAFLAVSAQAADKSSHASADENAIRATVDSYVAAFNRGDAQAVAEHWSDSGQWLSPSGERFQGKEAIAKEMESLFAGRKGVRIEVINPAIRTVAPGVAVEEGTVRVSGPEQPPRDSTYVAVHVKKGSQWKLDTVRETDVPEGPPASGPLQDLAWLVGQWVDESPEAAGEANVAWTKNKTFLTYTFRIAAPGSDELEGTQVIGWDAAAGTVRSWMFDSDGGFGEGTWTRKGDTWVVNFSQVLPDGGKASATNIYTIVDANSFTWKSIGRKLDGEFLPNIDEVKMVRKGAAPAASTAMEPAKATAQPRRTAAKKK